MSRRSSKQLFVCVENDQYEALLEKRKICVALNDSIAQKHGLVLFDESDDDHLYPMRFFRSINLPQSIKKAVLGAIETP